jgi:hypothetical protein
MKSNKILQIFGIFNLPDDFVGDRVDALECFLEYVKLKSNNQEVSENQDNDRQSVWKDLWNNDKFRFGGEFAIGELHETENRFVEKKEIIK